MRSRGTYASIERKAGSLENGHATAMSPGRNGEPSRRQQEKAPDNGEGGYDVDGVQPDGEHQTIGDADGAPEDTRFTEEI